MDELEKLMCSVPGCNKRWSVKIDAPKCSEHQWSDKKPATKRDIVVALTHPPVQHWQDDEVF
jgi:hypothetical protein